MENQSKEISIFKFENHELRAKMIDGEPWFVGKDACQMLDLKNVSDALGKLDEDEKGIGQTDTLGGSQSTLWISLPGLQKLIFRSDKPEANRITRWVTHEVLPAIYKTGSYTKPGLPPAVDQLAGLDAVIAQAEQEVRSLTRKASAVYHMKQARSLWNGDDEKGTPTPGRRPLSVPALNASPSEVLQTKILAYVAQNQGNVADKDKIPTRRNMSRYIKSADIKAIRRCVIVLKETGKLVEKKTGKAVYYQLVEVA